MTERTKSIGEEETVDVDIPAPEFTVGSCCARMCTCYGLECLREVVAALTLEANSVNALAKLERKGRVH